MRNIIINLLFKLLGNSNTRLNTIDTLFDAENSSFDVRKKKWKRALARAWRDKDLLDFFYYQAESDKENVFKGKINADLSKGARIRTLFIVFSAKMAYDEEISKRSDNRRKSEEIVSRSEETKKVYKNLTDVVAK